MSEYVKLKNKGLRRGRKPLSKEESEQRKVLYARRQEAHRRAKIVLQNRYPEEYEKIYQNEYRELTKNSEN